MVRLTIVILLLMPCKGFAQQTWEQLVQSYQKMALEENKGIKAGYEAYVQSLKNVTASGALPDPELSIQWFLDPMETFMGRQRGSIMLMQMFPWLGTLSAEKALAAAKSKTAFLSFQQQKSTLFFLIEETLAELIETHHHANILSEQLDLLDKMLVLASAGLEHSQVGLIQLMQLRMDLAELKAMRKEVTQRALSKKAQLRALVGNEQLDIAALSHVETDLKPIHDINPLLQRSGTDAPEVQVMQAMADEMREDVRRMKAMSRPMLGAGFEYMHMSPSNNPMVMETQSPLIARFSITIPWQTRKNAARVEVAQHEQKRAEFARENAAITMRSEVLMALNEYASALEWLDVFSTDLLPVNLSMTELMLNAWQSGDMRLDEVMTMRRQYLDLTMKQIEYQTMALKSRAKIHWLTAHHYPSTEAIKQD